MEAIECFMITRTSKVEINLRRYSRSDKGCSLGGGGYHNAYTHVGEDTNQEARGTGPNTQYPKTDTRWPLQCGCGYVFSMEDEWQVNYEPVYMDSRGNEYLFRMPSQFSIKSEFLKIPPGAMWDADWMKAKGPDGLSLTVMTPEGEWWIDGPSHNGGSWSRSGIPPKISVRPSIAIGAPVKYHAFLTDGRLVPC